MISDCLLIGCSSLLSEQTFNWELSIVNNYFIPAIYNRQFFIHNKHVGFVIQDPLSDI